VEDGSCLLVPVALFLKSLFAALVVLPLGVVDNGEGLAQPLFTIIG
jgi:hypothetical protein